MHRIGQLNEVHIRYLVMRDSVEETIMQLNKEKLSNATDASVVLPNDAADSSATSSSTSSSSTTSSSSDAAAATAAAPVRGHFVAGAIADDRTELRMSELTKLFSR